MSVGKGRVLAALPILLVLAPGVSWAQEGRATVTGRVVDATGAVIPGADVHVTSAETGATASAHTNETGNYTIPYLLPGTYTLVIEIAGFKTVERKGIGVRVGDVLALDVTMQV